MKLETSSEAISQALQKFDADHRSAAEWKNWEKKRSQKFALEHIGKIYPPKKIVSLATNLPVISFYGGRPTNTLLEQHGFKIVQLAHAETSPGPVPIPTFQVGETYSRKNHITGKFGGSAQSGIAPSAQAPAIFVFTGESGEQYGYRDHFDKFGNLIYTGEGKKGDMAMSKGNLAITRHAMDGRAIHVFEGSGKGKPYTYLGEFFYGSHEFKRGPDEEGKDRELILFCLVPVSATVPSEDSPLENAGTALVGASFTMDLTALRAAAVAACQPNLAPANPKDARRTTYKRSEQVKAYVLARAAGECELCDEPAPFMRKSDSTPYLEPHHINRLSDGGLDHPLHVGAICPTCHSHIHFGIDGATRNDELRNRIQEKEAEIIAGVVI